MLSFLLPQNVNLFVTPGYIKMEGPFGSFIKKTGGLSFNIVETSEGSRLFVTGSTSSQSATALSHMFRLALGLSRGFRRRLRLVGIGFRAVTRDFNYKNVSQASPIQTQNYRRKRRQAFYQSNQAFKPTTGASQQLLSLKIGYSHESAYPISTANQREIKSSRLEGRSKGTLISIKGNNLTQVNQVASEIRSFRLPDIYKGKGIYYDQEVVKLKKGKRQG